MRVLTERKKQMDKKTKTWLGKIASTGFIVIELPLALFVLWLGLLAVYIWVGHWH